MTAFEFIKSLPHVPMQLVGDKPMIASNSEKRRWLQNKAIIINGVKSGPDDEIVFPITELVFFPNGKRKCTMR